MPRVQYVKKARESSKERVCRRCRHVIEPGEAYKYADKKTGPRSSVKLIWCANCRPKQSELASGRRAEVLSITEGIEESISAAERCDSVRDQLADLQSTLEYAESDIYGFAGELADGARNIEDGFGHETAQSEAMASTAEEFEQWSEDFRELAEEISGYLRDPSDEEEEEGIPEEDVSDFFSRAWDLVNDEPDLDVTG